METVRQSNRAKYKNYFSDDLTQEQKDHIFALIDAKLKEDPDTKMLTIYKTLPADYHITYNAFCWLIHKSNYYSHFRSAKLFINETHNIFINESAWKLFIKKKRPYVIMSASDIDNWHINSTVFLYIKTSTNDLIKLDNDFRVCHIEQIGDKMIVVLRLGWTKMSMNLNFNSMYMD